MYKVLVVVPDPVNSLCYYYCYHCYEQKPIHKPGKSLIFVMSSEKSENYRNKGSSLLPSSLHKRLIYSLGCYKHDIEPRGHPERHPAPFILPLWPPSQVQWAAVYRGLSWTYDWSDCGSIVPLAANAFDCRGLMKGMQLIKKKCPAALGSWQRCCVMKYICHSCFCPQAHLTGLCKHLQSLAKLGLWKEGTEHSLGVDLCAPWDVTLLGQMSLCSLSNMQIES